MLILNIVRFILGYVEFTACGGFPERFLNLCRIRGISLWNVRCDGNILSGFADRNSYKKMRAVAKSSGMKMRIEQKTGLSFFLNRHSRRVGLIAGMCIMAAVITILSTRLWSIDVTGNTNISSEEIISAFEKAGVKKGMPTSKINSSEIEYIVQPMLKGISWVNINIRGSSALIEVRETVENEDKTGDGKPSNLVAASDGILVILRPFNGTAEAKTGNAVMKGDLLISGIEQNRDFSVNFCDAEGYAVAKTDKKISSAAKRSINAEKCVNIKNSYELGFFGLNIPLGKPSGEKIFELKSEVRINGVTLPLSVTRKSTCETGGYTAEISENRCMLLALSDYFSKCDGTLKYVKPEKIATEISVTDNGCIISGNAVCLENIGKSELMNIEDSSGQIINRP